jgi:hypothetical protein
MARPHPKPEFEAQLPQPERNPLAPSVSALMHAVLILAILLLSKKMEEREAEKPKADSAATREVAMVYVPPPKPPAPRPVEPPPPAPPVQSPQPRVINKQPEPEPNAPPEAPRTQGTVEPDQPRSPDPVGDPTAPPPTDNTPPAPEQVNKEDALNASMEVEARRIFGRKKGGVVADAGPVATRPFENANIPDNVCPEIPKDSTGAIPDGVVKGRVVQQETGRPLSNAHLQMVGQKYATFADANGDFELHFDLNLMAECRVQYVTIVAPGYRSQMLPIVMGGGISTVPLKRR